MALTCERHNFEMERAMWKMTSAVKLLKGVENEEIKNIVKLCKWSAPRSVEV